MSIVRFLLRSVAFFFGGMLSFFLLLIALAAILCLLLVGLACGLFTLWAMIHYAIYLTGHDRQAGHHAVQAIMIAAGCFGFIVLTFATITDLYQRVTRPRPLSARNPVADPAPDAPALGATPRWRLPAP